jgi:2-desacetyl-2-hydroxyethyl bacteriochlorophyllide A dehydrogenase
LKAVVFLGVGKGISVQEVPTPRVEHGSDVLVRVRECGICGSDLAILEGRHHSKPPVVLGHELSGEVEAVGKSVTGSKPGDHVVVDPNVSCGVCQNCRTGKRNMCENMVELGITRDGGFSKFMVVPQEYVYRVDASLPWKDGALVEPLACVVHGLERSGARPGETVVVYGAGPMGLLWVSMLKRVGSGKVISVDLAENRRAAAARVGADVTINPSEEDAVKRVLEETDGLGADIAVEMVGRAETMENAVNSTGPGGRVVVMGVAQNEAVARVAPFGVMSRELSILGSNANTTGFIPAIRLIEAGALPVNELVSHELAIDQAEKGFELCRSGEALKVMITPD